MVFRGCSSCSSCGARDSGGKASPGGENRVLAMTYITFRHRWLGPLRDIFRSEKMWDPHRDIHGVKRQD